MINEVKFVKYNHPHPLIKALREDHIRLDEIQFRVVKNWGSASVKIIPTNSFTKSLFGTNRSGYADNTWLSIFLVHFYEPGDYMICDGEWYFHKRPYQYVWVFGSEMLWNGQSFIDDQGREQWDHVNIEFVMRQLKSLLEKL